MKVIPVDCNYVEPNFACSYFLLQELQGNRSGFFVECNTNYAIPYLQAAAEKEGLTPDQVEGLIITHVHLDHAGGAGLFLKTFPKAKVYAHPRAAKHLIHPEKLIASATAVYGATFMEKVYGTILPCPAERVVILEDHDLVQWHNVTLNTHHTRGHANHHLCVVLPESSSNKLTVFTGDSFGVSYPQLSREPKGATLGVKKQRVILASTSPTDFDGKAALETVKWIESVHQQSKNGARIGLTHYGWIEPDEVIPAARALERSIQFSMDLIETEIKINEAGVTDASREPLTLEQCRAKLEQWLVNDCEAAGIRLTPQDLKLLSVDLTVNAQGLLFQIQKASQK